MSFDPTAPRDTTTGLDRLVSSVPRHNLKTPSTEDRFLTFRQLHERWGGEYVSDRSIWRWAKRRGLRSVKIGGKALFSLREIAAAEERARS